MCLKISIVLGDLEVDSKEKSEKNEENLNQHSVVKVAGQLSCDSFAQYKKVTVYTCSVHRAEINSRNPGITSF